MYSLFLSLLLSPFLSLPLFHCQSPFLFPSLSLPPQPSHIDRVPWCYYPEDYGYTTSTVTENEEGLTFDLNRNPKYRSSGRPDSPDINTLRVEIRYLSSYLLKFKVRKRER